jgi:two-component system chemotaxis response regulator CheY
MNDYSANRDGASARQDLSAVRILTLDDEPTMRMIIRSILRQAGCQDVQQAGDGHSALRMIERSRMDLVICDWQMSPMNGLQFVQALRASATGGSVPVIMLTANSEATDAQSVQALNVSGWLVKPVSSRRLVERVRSVLHLPDQVFSLEADLGVDFGVIGRQYRERLKQDLDDLTKMVARLPTQVARVHESWISIIGIFHRIKGQAATFNLQLVTDIAALGQDLLRAVEEDFDAAPKLDSALYRPLAALAGAMTLVLQNNIEGDGGAVGQKLLAKLKSVTEPVRLALEEATRDARF